MKPDKVDLFPAPKLYKFLTEPNFNNLWLDKDPSTRRANRKWLRGKCHILGSLVRTRMNLLGLDYLVGDRVNGNWFWLTKYEAVIDEIYVSGGYLFTHLYDNHKKQFSNITKSLKDPRIDAFIKGCKGEPL